MIWVLNDIDRAFSPCVFLLYCYMLSSQFCVLSHILANSGNLGPLALIVQGCQAVDNTVWFLLLTISAASVSEAGEEISLTLRYLRETVLDEDLCSQEIMALMMFKGNICKTHFTVTTWKMFKINRGVILTTTGVMVSYGVLSVQFT